MFFRVAANVKRLGFCGVYAQGIFHAIEPNCCYVLGGLSALNLI